MPSLPTERNSMAIIETAKEVVQLVQKIDNIELYKQILDLQREIFELVDENRELKTNVKQLNEALTINHELFFENNAYWRKTDGLNDGPFCTHCWDRERKL